jgi:hypothetical protein
LKTRLPAIGTDVRWNRTEGTGVVTKLEDLSGQKTFQVFWFDNGESIGGYTVDDLIPSKIEILRP